MSLSVDLQFNHFPYSLQVAGYLLLETIGEALVLLLRPFMVIGRLSTLINSSNLCVHIAMLKTSLFLGSFYLIDKLSAYIYMVQLNLNLTFACVC